MKKLITFLILGLLLIAGQVFAVGYHGTGLTPADSRSSFAAGDSWLAWDALDFSAYGTGNWEVILTDSSGNRARGIAGVVGTGETLGSELAPTSTCTDPADDQDNTTGWSPSNATLSSVAGGYNGFALLVARNAGNPAAFKGFSTVTGRLLRIAGRAKQKEEATVQMAISETGDYGISIAETTWEAPNDWNTQKTLYGVVGSDTAIYTIVWVSTTNATDGAYFDDISTKQVTEPAATGIHILNGPGGSEAWAEIDSSFDYNNIVEIEIVPAATAQGVTLNGVSIQ